MKYRELQDCLQLGPFGEAVQLCLERLRILRTIDSELYLNALQSSALLCLAGLRAESPYHSFSVRRSAFDINRLNRALQPIGLGLFSEDNLSFAKAKEDQTVFSIFNLEVLSGLPNRYRLLRSLAWPALPPMAEAADFLAVFSSQQWALMKAVDAGTLPPEWSHYWWSPHDIRFGMQLGYPGAAIASYVWAEALHDMSVSALTELTIDAGQEFLGPNVSFGCHPGLVNDPEMVEQLTYWRNLIAQVREAVTHASVLTDASLARAYAAMQRADEAA